MTQTAPSITGQAAQNRRPPKLDEVPAFVEAIKEGWATPDRDAVVVEGTAEAAAAHRRRLAAEFRGRPIVIAAGRAPTRSNDTRYDFRPDSDFAWLSGCTTAEDAVLVLDATSAVLYLPTPALPGERGFFADAAQGELWVGPVPGPDDWARALDLEVRPLTAFEENLGR